MINHKPINLQRLILQIFSDENLTKKAFLNSLYSILEYATRLIVGFIVQPLLVSGLGSYFFGTWQILQRFVGYISPLSGPPAQALRWAIAGEQNSSEIKLKQQYISGAIAVWVIFIPIYVLIGSLLVWNIPLWIKAPTEYNLIIRLATSIIVINLSTVNLVSIPQSVLQGENQGYKLVGVSVFLIITEGGLIWLALYLQKGIVGIAVATLLLTPISGFLYLKVVRKHICWFGCARSSLEKLRNYFGINVWFLLWNLILSLMMTSDIIILGILHSVESVTNYSLTKYAPETLISIIAIMMHGVTPGLGGIIGSGDKDRASNARNEIMAITWLTITAMGSTLVVWNRTFLTLWVGIEHYAGDLPNLLIVLVVMQFVLIRNDWNFIDLTLKLQRKVALGAISVALSLTASVVLVGNFGLGITGISIGILFGRAILSFGYPALVGSYLNIPWVTQLKAIIRPVSLTAIILIIATILGNQVFLVKSSDIIDWTIFMFLSGITVLISLLVSFYLGFTKDQRVKMLYRIKIVIPLRLKQ